ncbi:MAG: aminotransferase class I/II-fold pyridoxal phosphate-dependent enzyme [Gammaproteobacteria bacterium]|nr:MAG: aminotransferase class I/II-fold pyridoxal phosphate-dependent enzyme [Gammaproteobacteria bacterium]TLZ61673.1 MAG: aminotransferase class I/II-fold pyridoxal phosphate-dependent enzyme [Gammaproteobacteria bacterium]
MSESSLRIETKLVHAGEPLPRILGAVEMPIFQSATFEYGGEGSYHDVRYLRTNNTPSQLALQAKIAALENAPAALVTASGMAAISTTLLTVLSAGDRLLAQSCLYGGTHDLMNRDFATLGLAVDFIDADRRESWQAQLRPTTRAIYVEAMTNPLLQVADLEAVVEFARAHGLISIIDNTFASPVNFRPIEAGFDLSIHSATKYLNGHADIVAGVVSGGAELIERIRHKANHLGGSLDPHAAFLLSRGLKTLALRVRYQNESTLRIARFLEGHRAVECVHYAGLESHPRHARARSLFAGFGGVLSFELEGPASRADEFAARVRLPIVAPSLGGVHTLLTRPATTSHAGLAPEERARLGIGDGLLRLSVGIESTEDLLEDLERALR